MTTSAAAPLLFVACAVAACSSSGSVSSSAPSPTAGSANGGSAGSVDTSTGGANGGTAGSNHANGGAAGTLIASAGAGGSNGGRANAGGSPGASGSGNFGGNAGSSGAGGSSSGGAAVGTIVPLYTDPSDASWAAIIAAKNAHPAVAVVAIVNPNSGPGAHADAGFTTGIARLLAASIVPIGYVSTAYTARGEAAVKADIDSWHSFYPSLAGIFFDEQSDKADDALFYRDVATYARQHALTFTVGNPGASVPASFLDTVDVMLIYEDKGVPSLSSLAGYAAKRTHYGVIPYGAPFDAAFVDAAKADVQYIYATSDDLPNPWDTLTPYFDQLLTRLSP